MPFPKARRGTSLGTEARDTDKSEMLMRNSTRSAKVDAHQRLQQNSGLEINVRHSWLIWWTPKALGVVIFQSGEKGGLAKKTAMVKVKDSKEEMSKKTEKEE
ncbi:hypothetical protein H920_10600 [Fukomys damarensis]|uniref:Uncharacterized protein n=1 Tax=Fukomys damarensis TaxID=885580 RepID=A0A091D794_FUKDA|nr:hypothetical protein H920_10600 [Fukomys damarensis]